MRVDVWNLSLQAGRELPCRPNPFSFKQVGRDASFDKSPKHVLRVSLIMGMQLVKWQANLRVDLRDQAHEKWLVSNTQEKNH